MSRRKSLPFKVVTRRDKPHYGTGDHITLNGESEALVISDLGSRLVVTWSADRHYTAPVFSVAMESPASYASRTA